MKNLAWSYQVLLQPKSALKLWRAAETAFHAVAFEDKYKGEGTKRLIRREGGLSLFDMPLSRYIGRHPSTYTNSLVPGGEARGLGSGPTANREVGPSKERSDGWSNVLPTHMTNNLPLVTSLIAALP